MSAEPAGVEPSATSVFEWIGPRVALDALVRKIQSAGAADGYGRGESGRFLTAFVSTFSRPGVSPDRLEAFERLPVYPAEQCCLWAMLRWVSEHEGAMPRLDERIWMERALTACLHLYGWWREARGPGDEWRALGVALQSAVAVPALARPVAQQVEWGWARQQGSEACGAARVVLAGVSGSATRGEAFEVARDSMMRDAGEAAMVWLPVVE